MHEANLDDGAMWPTAFALKDLTAAEEKKIGGARQESRELIHARAAHMQTSAACCDRLRSVESGLE